MFLIKQFVYKVIFNPRRPSSNLVYVVEALEQSEAISKLALLYSGATFEFIGELSGTIPRKD